MRKVGFHQIRKWRTSVKFACFGVAFICGILTACPLIALMESQLSREPSTETRMKVNAELRACTLNESELPNGWSKDWPTAFPLYVQPVPSGMLGGILIKFPHQGSSARFSAVHEIQFYDRTLRAMYAYRTQRGFSNSRWHATWKPLDLTQANLSADEFRAACGDFAPDVGAGREDKTCQVQARYGRFISVFTADISPRNMSEAEMVLFLQAIDRHMLQCVES